MKSELQKLKGKSIKTNIGEINFKQIIRLQNSQFDQIYFKTNYKDSICKVYDLKQSISVERYNNEVQQYKPAIIPILYRNVHYEIFKYKGKQYGILIYIELAKYQSIVTCIFNINFVQILKLTLDLLTLIQHMKNQSYIYYNVRPFSIFKNGNDYALIDCEYVQSEGEIKYYLKNMVEKDWKYWAPELLDPYSKHKIDYNVDLFALGCLLYEIKRGQFPFESKLAQMHLSYTILENPTNNIIIEIMTQCLSSYENRNKIDINKYIVRISKILEDEGSPIKNKSKNIVRKGSNTGIFDNFTTAFSKLVNDTQGYFLNYTEDNDKDPQDKYLENILSKIYKAHDKIQKLRGVAQKYLNTIKNKPFSMVKFCLLIGNIFRKGPKGVYKEFKDLVKEMASQSNQSEQYYLMIDLLVCKFSVHKKVRKCMAGNFYINQISEFKNLEIKDFGNLVVYLQKLTGGLKKFTSDLKNSTFSVPIMNFICDEIYDVTSMLIISIVALRKDNDLQLRNDNLQELLPIEKMLNSCLKKISYLSNFISAHAIYSIENDYIVYQEEINLLFNPYYSSLQHFYKSLRGYKGLSIPNNYYQLYTQIQKPVNKSPPHQNKQGQNHEKKSYFLSGQQQDSDEQGHEEKAFNNEYYDMSSTINHQKKQKPAIFQQVKKSGSMHQSKNKNNNSNSNASMVKKSSPSVSFEDFINIAKKPESKEKTKKQNEFSMFFNDLKGHKSSSTKKQPINMSCTNSSPRRNIGFQEFSNIPMKKATEKKQNKNQSILDFDFKQLSKMNSPPKFDNNPFVEETKKNTSVTSLLNFQNFDKFGQNQSHSLPVYFPPPVSPTPLILPPPQKTNPYIEQILKSLKLKQLKDLLLKNQKFILKFQDLTFNKVIGSGSAGQVSSGKYQGEAVAIKRVKFRQNPNALKEFERELVTYIKINQNENLVSLIGLAESNGDFYLVTEFCQYGSLFDLLHRRPDLEFTWKQRLKFAIEIAQGVLFLHSMKPVIIHRDLKSLNVFVAKQNNDFHMKVADFGLSRSPEAEMMTTQLGTIHWMAPQLLQGKQYSIKVDVYSYGVLLWEIISRKTPYNNLKNPMAILKYVAIDKMRPDLSQVPAQCPKQLIDIAHKCWEHDPAKRPSFSSVLQQLKMISL